MSSLARLIGVALLGILAFMVIFAIPVIAINGWISGQLVRALLLMLSLSVAIGLWSLAFQSALISAAGLYGFEKLRFGWITVNVRRDEKRKEQIKLDTIIFLFISIITLTYIFSILYGLIGVIDEHAFTESSLSFVSALYYSYSAITNSLQAGIMPLSDTARLLTLIEMIFGLLYVLLFFSHLAVFIRDGKK